MIIEGHNRITKTPLDNILNISDRSIRKKMKFIRRFDKNELKNKFNEINIKQEDK